jgi:hypothetical protein
MESVDQNVWHSSAVLLKSLSNVKMDCAQSRTKDVKTIPFASESILTLRSTEENSTRTDVETQLVSRTRWNVEMLYHFTKALFRN